MNEQARQIALQKLNEAVSQPLTQHQTGEQIVNQANNSVQKSISKYDATMQSLLTGDKAIDALIRTPESQWSPYQIAVANLNKDLRDRNKKFQQANDKKLVLENQQANIASAGQIMMAAYRDAMNKSEASAEKQMNANTLNANIQAGSAISGSGGLSNNPAAAAQTRLTAHNQANAQNMQIAANRDATLANLTAQGANAELQAAQAQKQMELQEKQINANIDNANKQLANAAARSQYSTTSKGGNGTSTVTKTFDPSKFTIGKDGLAYSSDGKTVIKPGQEGFDDIKAYQDKQTQEIKGKQDLIAPSIAALVTANPNAGGVIAGLSSLLGRSL
jgi:hypothetical protein